MDDEYDEYEDHRTSITVSSTVISRARTRLEQLNLFDPDSDDISVLSSQIGHFHQVVKPKSLHDDYKYFLTSLAIRLYKGRAKSTGDYKEYIINAVGNFSPGSVSKISTLYWESTSKCYSGIISPSARQPDFISGPSLNVLLISRAWYSAVEKMKNYTGYIIEPLTSDQYDCAFVHAIVLLRKLSFLASMGGIMYYNEAYIIGLYAFAFSSLQIFGESASDILNHSFLKELSKFNEDVLINLLKISINDETVQHDITQYSIKETFDPIGDKIIKCISSESTRNCLIYFLVALLCMNEVKSVIQDTSESNNKYKAIYRIEQLFNAENGEYINGIISRNVVISSIDVNRAYNQCCYLVDGYASRYETILFGY